ncbi:hypothetical protein ACFPPD_01735 [Cohnella suwonensis]|uniref:Uncharacterized protein n=1 Tax=Cohnella suwonensis TaxID=696072 RepID=A0ABW0LNE9_9BACL
MKRYRVLHMSFDTRATILNTQIEENWEEDTASLWKENKKTITQGLFHEYGGINFEAKLAYFKEFGPMPFSIIAYHNNFFKNIRDSYVIGSFYPALTAACSLGERILNQLILSLREDFKATPQYKDVYSKKSFDNWDKVIATLESWNVLLAEVVTLFFELKDLRNFSIHFNPETDRLDKELALKAITLLKEIISLQFGIGNQPWFIHSIPGVIYVKKEAEEWPFVKKVIIPNCVLVGYLHKLEHDGSWFKVVDDHEYDDREVTDDEFKELLASR